MGAVHDVDEDTLRQLVDLRADGETVLSIYLNLDPAEVPTPPARASEIDSVLSEARREVERGERPRAERLVLRSALDRARATLEATGAPMKGARALALFVCEPLGLERVLRLARPAPSTAYVSDAPFIEPLAEQGAAGRVCVALIDERCARILRGSRERLREAASFEDPVHGRHDRGGWSQARYQRSVQEDIEAHLRHSARVLHRLLEAEPYERLLIGCTEPLWPRIVDRLHADVRARLHGERLSIDLSDLDLGELERAVEDALAVERREHEDALLEELREHHGRDGRAASGLDDVLRALVERRVEALIYEAGLQAPGVSCSRCGWMSTHGERCPVDGVPLQRRVDIVDEAVQSALGQSAEVLVLRERPDLGPLGRIAATLRF